MSSENPVAEFNPSYLAESRAPQIFVGSIVPTAFATSFVLARLYSRLILLKSWGLDDLLICISWVVTLTLAILTGLSTRYGAGRHMGAYDNHQGTAIATKLGFVCRILYQVSLAMIKLGVCVFYYRVFQDRISKRLVYLMAGFISITSSTLILASIFQCRPIEAAWTTDHGICPISVTQVYALSVTSIVADVSMLLFVIPRIFGLRLTQKQTISCLAIVSLSGLSIVAAAIRWNSLLWTAHHSNDLPWDSYDVGIWNLVAVDVGLICASAPALKPLIRKVAPDFLSSFSNKTFGSTRRSIGSSRVRGQVIRSNNNLELSSQSDFKSRPSEITGPKEMVLERSYLRKTSSDSEAAVIGLKSLAYH